MNKTRFSLMRWQSTIIGVLLGMLSIISGAEPGSVLSDWKMQYSDLQKQIAETKALAKAGSGLPFPESQVFDRQSLIWPEDGSPLDVGIRRTEALLYHLRSLPGAPNMDGMKRQLEELKARRLILSKVTAEGDADLNLYLELRKITRQAQFSNPLLDFDDLLFVEWGTWEDDPEIQSLELYEGEPEDYDGGHMVDQYFGHNGHRDCNLLILKDFKTDSSRVVDVTEGLRIPNGTHAGKLMSEGAFISPDLSWDGKTVVFGWSSGLGWEKKWVQENRYHLFRVNLDGTGLQRLTDTNNDDFDPCWLPNGRVVFISDRRGGNGRCHGRWAASYTLYSMKADGSDLFAIDWHETNEWHPSVDHNGMIVYTRWDYIDREDCIAHHIWTCFPDGRDPRAPHGNYPVPLTTMSGSNWPDGRVRRPFSEFNIRAIPGSHKYVATAGPHHGQSFGSLVILDTRIPDDNEMSQVKRLTPDVPFAESETGPYDRSSWHYGTPWPLSEDFYLCNYWDGIYLLDKFGNRELIYRTTRVSYLRPIDPIPVKPRETPPVIPTATCQGERLTPDAPNATIYVNNVYVTDEFGALPEGVNIKWMRIVQVFPKTTNKKNDPMVAHASESLVRMPLGVVPVEEDGSVYCEAPVEKEIYFQLLDENGMAVQSMRSGTYVHPGEQMSCTGCHESKWESPPITPNPLAMQRSPSRLEPEVNPEYIWPFGFYRTVKPVLDEKCASCHTGQGGPDMSYASLKNYVFGFPGDQRCNYQVAEYGGSRTVPGKFGAHYAPLTQYLDASHYEVDLSGDEFRRITLWLDLNSNELSAYRNVDAQKSGEIVWPLLDVDPDSPQGVERREVSGLLPKQVVKQPVGVKATAVPGRIIVEFPVTDRYTVTVHSITGKQVGIYQTGLTGKFSISTEWFAHGVYSLNAESESERYVLKIFMGQ